MGIADYIDKKKWPSAVALLWFFPFFMITLKLESSFTKFLQCNFLKTIKTTNFFTWWC